MEGLLSTGPTPSSFTNDSTIILIKSETKSDIFQSSKIIVKLSEKKLVQSDFNFVV